VVGGRHGIVVVVDDELFELDFDGVSRPFEGLHLIGGW
jgi:hypothetical protein